MGSWNPNLVTVDCRRPQWIGICQNAMNQNRPDGRIRHPRVFEHLHQPDHALVKTTYSEPNTPKPCPGRVLAHHQNVIRCSKNMGLTNAIYTPRKEIKIRMLLKNGPCLKCRQVHRPMRLLTGMILRPIYDLRPGDHCHRCH